MVQKASQRREAKASIRLAIEPLAEGSITNGRELARVLTVQAVPVIAAHFDIQIRCFATFRPSQLDRLKFHLAPLSPLIKNTRVRTGSVAPVSATFQSWRPARMRRQTTNRAVEARL